MVMFLEILAALIFAVPLACIGVALGKWACNPPDKPGKRRAF